MLLLLTDIWNTCLVQLYGEVIAQYRKGFCNKKVQIMDDLFIR